MILQTGRGTIAGLCLLMILALTPAAGAGEGKLPAVPRGKVRSAKPAPAKAAKTTTATLKGAKKAAPAAGEQAYWELCRRLINAANEPGAQRVLVRDVDKFAQEHKTSPFGARAQVMAGEIMAGGGDFKSALQYYQQAEEAFRVNSVWKDSPQYLPYIGLRTGDALAGESNHLGALAMWKRTFTMWPASPLAGQCLAKIIETNSTVLTPDQAWRENEKFLSEALRAPKIGPEVRDAAQIARLKVLAGAAEKGFYPRASLVGEIDRFLTAWPPGKNAAIDKARDTLARLRANALAAAQVKPPPPPQVFFRKLSDSTSTMKASPKTPPLPAMPTPAPPTTPAPNAARMSMNSTRSTSSTAPHAAPVMSDEEVEAHARALARAKRNAK